MPVTNEDGFPSSFTPGWSVGAGGSGASGDVSVVEPLDTGKVSVIDTAVRDSSAAVLARLQGGIDVTESSPISLTPTNVILTAIETEITNRLGNVGQSTMAGSTPVVIASNQTKVSVTLLDSGGTALSVDAGHNLIVNVLPLDSTNDSITAVISGIPTVLISGMAAQVAHDAADTSNPLKVGGRARITNRTPVADGDRTDLATDDQGRLSVSIGNPRQLRGSQAVTLTNGTETTLITAVASVYHDIRTIIVANGSTTDVNISIRDDTAGTVIMTFSVKAGTTSGASFVQSVPQTAQNKNWTAQASATPSGGTANVIVTAFFDTTV